ncbi:MarR family transcriptional regulator [Halioxenophilus sp. WMMB6]|uniref:MarR family winged helix-turn-helix transcriptional regulator n=1 Tax=Halioxenophilus sp. WMMB6 TaxID=3073815 RepID=UPI00295E8BA4|nr:MarR family transcriptional regulator [Halioxenophilus sp. WMMB6]
MSNSEEVLVALRRVIRATDLHSKYLAKTSGLTAPQILLLQAIQAKPQVTIGEIAADISLSQATVTSILDRLEKRELVIRERSQSDRRKVHASLTPRGQQALESAPTPLQEQFIERFNRLKKWEQNMIIASLQRVAEMMDAEDIEAAPMLEVGNLD